MKTFKNVLLVLLVYITFCTNPMAGQVELINETTVTNEGLYFWYPNGRKAYHYAANISPRGDCFTIVNGYVFFGWYKGGMNTRNLMLSRMKLGTNKWVTVQFNEKNSFIANTPGWGDSHNTISVGVSKKDGTIHLLFDHHNTPLNYIVSKKNAAFVLDNEFKKNLFNPKQGYFKPGENVRITYPTITENDQGDLIVNYRKGSAIGGNEMVHVYNGDTSKWSSAKQVITGSNASIPESQKNYAYGQTLYANGQIYYSFSVRWKRNKPAGILNEGVYLAKCGQTMTGDWEDMNGKKHKLPIIDYSPFLIADTKNLSATGSSTSPKAAVSDNGDVYINFRGRGSGSQKAVFTRFNGQNTFTENKGTLLVGEFYGNRMYAAASNGGKITIQSTKAGELNWRTDYTLNTGKNYSNMVTRIVDGKLVVLAQDGKSGSDKQPIWCYAFDLGGSTTPNQAPKVSFKSPSGNITVDEGYKLNIEVNASDPDGSINNVKLYINNSLLRQENVAPYEWGHATSPNPNELNGRKAGTYTIKAVATDNKGKTAETSITMTVKGEDPDNQTPVVSFKKPTGNTIVTKGYDLTVEVNASVANGSINNVKLYINNNLIRQENVAPYEWGHDNSPNPNEVNNLPVGTHTFKAVATDNEGTTSEKSFTLTVKDDTNPNPSGNCKFGTPRNSGIPALDKVVFNNIYVVGTGGPSLNNFKKFTLNWVPEQNGLYQFAINTTNGSPDWYVDFKNSMTFQLKNAKPEVTLNNTGFAGLDGSYWINSTSNSFIMVSKTKGYSIHFSNAASAPSCSNKNNDNLADGTLIAEQNPFSNVLTLSGFGKNAISAFLYNVNGKQIHQTSIKKGVTQIFIQTNDLSKGVYFAKVISDGKTNTVKVIKK